MLRRAGPPAKGADQQSYPQEAELVVAVIIQLGSEDRAAVGAVQLLRRIPGVVACCKACEVALLTSRRSNLQELLSQTEVRYDGFIHVLFPSSRVKAW